jgi:hypothetical protein
MLKDMLQATGVEEAPSSHREALSLSLEHLGWRLAFGMHFRFVTAG